MARIKIKDLPRDMKISKEVMRSVVGGEANPQPSPRPMLLSDFRLTSAFIYPTKGLIGMDPSPSP